MKRRLLTALATLVSALPLPTVTVDIVLMTVTIMFGLSFCLFFFFALYFWDGEPITSKPAWTMRLFQLSGVGTLALLCIMVIGGILHEFDVI